MAGRMCEQALSSAGHQSIGAGGQRLGRLRGSGSLPALAEVS